MYKWLRRGFLGFLGILGLAVALLIANHLFSKDEYVIAENGVTARWKISCPSIGAPRDFTSLVGSAWTDKTFVIKVADNDYCGGTKIANPRYSIQGEKLELRWTWAIRPGDAVTACACDHAVQFELENIPVKNYSVSLARER